jgi:DNA-binding response OmpR family regulator
MEEKGRVGKQETANRVLIIEGTSKLSPELAHSLTKAGFKVARIPNHPETLLAIHVFKPDIIIVDETIADSFEVCNQIRNARGTPVLLVSKETGKVTWEKSLIDACDFYLREPFDDKVLVSRLKSILATVT